jgi:hypothetical protein
MAQKRNELQEKNSTGVPNFIVMRGLLIGLFFAVASTFILTYQYSPDDISKLELRDVVPRNVLAPRQIVYTSTIKTLEARKQAENSVATVYTTPDLTVARKQINRLRKVFEYIDTVRADPYGTLPQKSEWLRAIPDLSLSNTAVDQILIMNEPDWDTTKKESLAILDRTLRNEIRENQLVTTRRRLQNQVALDTSETQTKVIVALAGSLIEANTFSDPVRTDEEKRLAVEKVLDVVEQIEENELILSEGQIIRSLDLEKLKALGLHKSQFNWLPDVVSPALLISLITVVMGIYLTQYAPQVVLDNKRLMLLACLVITFLLLARFIIPHKSISAYYYPIAALTMMTVVLIETQLSFALATMVAIMIGTIVTDDWMAVITYFILSSWTGVLALNKGRYITVVIRAVLYVVLMNVTVILIFTIAKTYPNTSPELGIVMAEGVINGVVSVGLAMIGLLGIGKLLGITTYMELQDLTRPTHPLLRQLLLKAPGTYHHSLMVSNLAEQAAERIGADALLVRVMAYYHDIGKMQRPYFFVENQPQGVNVHEKLEPKVSAQIIISHVIDGLELAKKHGLPQVIQDGIAQHHGTTLVKFFYYQSVKEANEKKKQVNEDDFRYPGPRPQNKENGILMLADVTESVVRALKPGSAKEIDEIVQKMIDEKLETGQLNECDLTIADLHKIREAFVDILQGVHHPRIKYPDPVKPDNKQTDEEKQEKPKKDASPVEQTSEPPADEKSNQKSDEIFDRKSKEITTKLPVRLPSSDSIAQPSKLIRRE